jgi:uncharacterized membrane protein YphA (DoxX/SURF4 family)
MIAYYYIMLNPFPEILDYAFFVPLILRVTLGLVLINLGALKLGSERERWTRSFEVLRIRPTGAFVRLFGIIEILGALAFLAGFQVQISAIIFSIIILSELTIEVTTPEVLKRAFPFYFLLFAIAFSLIFTGAGAIAVDLPL